jgi:hypothetical protein
MAVNFPDNPSNGDSFTSNGIVYVYTSTTTAWQKSYTSVPPVVTGHVLPDTNETYDLGSTTQRFRDLYLSGNSITIGDLVISDNNGVFEVTPSGGSAISFATQTDINTAISNLVDTAPGALDTLNELAAAIGDDANFATNITTSLANKLEASDLAGYVTQTGTETLSNKTLAATTLAGHIIPNSDSAYDLGSTTNRFRDLYLSGNTLYIGDVEISVNSEGLLQLPSGSLIDGAVVPTEIGQMTNVRLEPNPEVLEMAVDAPAAGHSAPWLWTWKSGALPYARSTILNQVQSGVPIYIAGTYTLFNFAAHELHGTMTQTHKIYLKWIEGAGTDNLVSWATSTLNVQNITFKGVNGDNATEVQRLNISVPSTITLPTLVAPNLVYDVEFANSGAYTFSGITMGDNPDIGPLYRGGTYTFNLDSSVSGHPFYLTQDDGTNWAQGQYVDEYTNGVTGSRNDSGTVQFVVPNDAPDVLYYQCGNHSSMRGMLTIKNLEVETNGAGNYVVYFQHDQEDHSVPVEIKQRPSIAGQSCLVYDSSLSEFVPQDLGEYITKTLVIQERIGELAEDKIVEKVNDDTVTNLTKVKEQTIFITNLNQQGELQLVSGTARWYAPFDLLVTGINTKVSSSADSNISIQIKKNGSTVKSSSILAGQFSSVVSAPEFPMVEGDYITVDVTSIGTTNKGEDLVVQFKYRQT